jgi:hypothetical protein
VGKVASNERNSLVSTINAIIYRQNAAVGWMKAITLDQLRIQGEACAQALSEYVRGTRDGLDVRLWLIRLFFDQKVCWLVPEDSCALHIASTPLLGVQKNQAEQVVDAIISVSEPDKQKQINQSQVALEPPEPDYEQLRHWFFRKLFEPEAVQWFANSPPVEVRPGHLPAVIGLDRERLSMFWFE